MRKPNDDFTPEEKAIENAFKDWYLAIFGNHSELIGQQVRTPVGVIDLLFVNRAWGNIIVVEVKKGRAPSGILSQVYSYFWYLQSLLDKDIFIKISARDEIVGKSYGIIVAESLDERTIKALEYSSEIMFYQYGLEDNHITFDHKFIRTSKKYKIDDRIEGWINIIKQHARANYIEIEKYKVLHNGGEYDPVLLQGDLEDKSNTIFINEKSRQ